jgi:hypothetical protein
MKYFPYGALWRGDHLNPHLGKPNTYQSKVFRGNARHVNNSSLYKRASVIDPNKYMRARVYARHADHCAEGQMSMSGREVV